MEITVEFFGVPRERAGRSGVTVRLESATVTVADVISKLAERFPRFAADCVADGRLLPSFSVNLNGERFVAGHDEGIVDGDSLLIMSADAGG